MPNKLSKIIPILSLTFLIFSILAFVFFYLTIVKKNKELQKSQLEWQAQVKKIDEMKQLERSMKSIKKEITLLETHFAESSDVVPFLDTVEGLASSVSIKAEITSVDAGKDNSSLTIVVKATGSFGNLYKFLNLLENSSYVLEFISMDMQKLGGQDLSLEVGPPDWQATFRIKLLSFLP